MNKENPQFNPPPKTITQSLYSDYEPNAEHFGGTYEPGCIIKLSSIRDPGKTWTHHVKDELLIGRADICPVRLEDKSVSRNQCKIVSRGAGLAVEHVGSTNKTYLNGVNIIGSAPVKSGDIIKFGRESLRVDYIQQAAPQSPPQKHEPDPGKDKDETETLFK